MRSFGQTIKNQRQKLDLTQRQVADSVGISDAYICSLESEKKSPPPYHTVASIADVLKLDTDKLWKIALKQREKDALEKSRRKIGVRGSHKEPDNNRSGDDNATIVPESQINAFFERPEIQMTAFGIFQKQPKDMTLEEKRIIYNAINTARKFVLGQSGN